MLLVFPLGIIIGLNRHFNALFGAHIEKFRFIPLIATTGIFIIWCGIGDSMKVQFLSFGIIVYLLPVVKQRVEEVDQVYVDTLKMLGASKWEIIRRVFIPFCIFQTYR